MGAVAGITLLYVVAQCLAKRGNEPSTSGMGFRELRRNSVSIPIPTLFGADIGWFCAGAFPRPRDVCGSGGGGAGGGAERGILLKGMISKRRVEKFQRVEAVRPSPNWV